MRRRERSSAPPTSAGNDSSSAGNARSQLARRRQLRQRVARALALVERAELFEDGERALEERPRALEVAGRLAQARLPRPRLRELVPRADRVADLDGGLEVFLRGNRILGDERLGEHALRRAFDVAVAALAARGQDFLHAL